MSDDFLTVNRERWDELVPLHARSEFYDLEGFKAGRISLMPLERKEMGDVAGRSLLHLQCHFGLDTLSWARLGARATGVDFSQPAIELARSLSAELGIEARFVCSDLYALPDALDGQFDIVFTSYGVLTWLPDLRGWARVVAHFLRPGGTFYMAEIHPFASVFYDGADATDLQVFYPYFHSPEPMRFEAQGSYATGDGETEHRVTYEWAHGLADVITSLIRAGLRIEFLHEFPFASYRMFPFLEQDDQGRWWLPERKELIPMTFSLRARQPGLDDVAITGGPHE
jgi:SAM-dependent methyltransferase